VTSPDVSVCVFTRNPAQDAFKALAQELQNQSASLDRWELIIIDNDSSNSVESRFAAEFSWHPNLRFVVENQAGFAYCHRRGVCESRSPLTLFLGDDCIPSSNYIENALLIMAENPDVGILTGNLTFTPPKKSNFLIEQMYHASYSPNLVKGLRKDYRKDGYSPALRGSAGMIVRKPIAQFWLEKFWVYDELTEFLEDYGVLPLRTTDLDFGMQALFHGYCIARSDQLFLLHNASEDRTQISKLLKLGYRSGFFDSIFRARWGWSLPFATSFPRNLLSCIKRMCAASQNPGCWIIRNVILLGQFYAEVTINRYPDLFRKWRLNALDKKMHSNITGFKSRKY
jgi:GT2 family glycosyltransferase